MPRRKKPSAPPAPAPTQAPVVGNPDSREFHVRAYASGSCNMDQITAQVEFDGVDDAIASGYKGCAWCLRNLDVGKRTDADEPATEPAEAE